MLLGLSGFAVSQPLLALAGEDPTLFTFAGVRGGGIVVFALVVALVPPLALWAFTVVVGAVNGKAGDVAFVVFASSLVGATVIQWVKSAGVENGLVLGVVGFGAVAGFAVGVVRVTAVSMWARFTAPLPVLSVMMLLVASPAGDLLRPRPDATGPTEASADVAPVVFLLLDELPLRTIIDADGSIDAERFPNMARLAGRSTWYRNYTTMSHRTLLAVPSILRGRAPSPDGILWTDASDNLFSLLIDTHHMTVSETATALCGFSTCGLGQSAGTSGLSSLLSQMWEVWKQRVRLSPVGEIDLGQFAEVAVPLDRDDLTVNRATSASPLQRVVEFLEAIEETREPHLYYLHLMLPHQPWTFYPDGRQHRSLEVWQVYSEDLGDWALAVLQQAHIWQMQYTDRVLGEILDRLEEIDLFDRSLVVVMSDHGVNFKTPPDLRELHTHTLGSISYAPLFIKSPGQVEGRTDDSNLMSFDVLPTIAAELGVTIDWDVDGFPAGSPQVEARGQTKLMYHFGNVAKTSRLQEIMEFDASEHAPRADDRFIPPPEPGERPIDGLMRYIGAEGEIGRTLTDLDPKPGAGRAHLSGIEEIRDPVDAPVAWVRGAVSDPSLGDTVLLLINDEVVSAAPVTESGNTLLLIPPDSLDMTGGNDVTLVQKGPDDYYLAGL